MAESALDRDLLFGVLAFQMDFVSRDALMAADLLCPDRLRGGGCVVGFGVKISVFRHRQVIIGGARPGNADNGVRPPRDRAGRATIGGGTAHA